MSVAQTIPYRPDIDGLRAISIVSVVLYHFGVPYFEGGFVGVDVFFVISGFLITSIVLAEIRGGHFSFARFYERRARRLLPTLAVVLLATFVAALVIMTPQDLAEFSDSLIHVLIFAANFFFADRGGYFDPSLDLAPLLHTWSLAVEEQFYIVWPLIAVTCFRFAPKRPRLVSLVLLAVSFAANVFIVEQDPLAAFYLPHTRVWELLAGCCLAFGARPPGRRSGHAAGLAGLALILFAVFTFDETTVFPGTAAVLPVLGAVLVLWSGQSASSIANRVLSLPPLAFVGLVSYAWYLWHWPMISLFRYNFERDPSAIEIVALIVASFALAVLCWNFVEQPVRRGLWWKPRARTLGASLATTAMLAALATASYASNGFIWRYSDAMFDLTRERLTMRSADHKCPRVTAKMVDDGDLCRLWETHDDATGILLWGDSHAGALRSVFRDMAHATDVAVTYIGEAACPPLIDAGRNRSGGRPEACLSLNAAVGKLLQERRFGDVVLAARWDYYAIGKGNAGTAKQHYLRDGQSTAPTLEENRAVMARGLRRTVEAIVASGARAWIVMEAPYAGFNVPNRAAHALMRGESEEEFFGLDAVEQKARAEFMTSLVAGLPVRVIDPSRSLCEGDRCLVFADGKPLYADDNHLSIYGADRLKPLLSDLFARHGDAAKLGGGS